MLARATPAELARIPRIRAEFRPGRPLAFELQRRGYAARGWVLPGSSASVLHGRWPSCGVAEKARLGRDLFRSEDDPPAAKPATPLLSLRWTFRATGSASVISTHGHAIPTAQATREAVEAGGLMSYGTSLSDMFRRVGVYTGSAAATRRRLRAGLGR